MNEVVKTNQINAFNFGDERVRTVVDNKGNPFFCLSDVTKVLGLQDRATSKFNLDIKGVEKITTPTSGGSQELIFINEPNLYRVVFRSTKDEAAKFQNWIYEDVIPTIRKTGSYAVQPQIALPQDYLSALKALVISEESKQALLVEYNEIKPKADAHDLLAGARGSFSIRAAAGELKVPERKFIQWLLDNDWAFREGNRQDGKLMPHAHRKEQGYLELVNTVAYNTGEPVARFQMKVTQKGIARLAQILSKHRAFLTHKINDCEVMA